MLGRSEVKLQASVMATFHVCSRIVEVHNIFVALGTREMEVEGIERQV